MTAFNPAGWRPEMGEAGAPSTGATASGDKTVRFPFERYSSAQVGEAFRRVIEDTGLYFGRSTAREAGRLFAKMAKGELVSKDASALMLEILKKQQVNDRLPRYQKLADKYGYTVEAADLATVRDGEEFIDLVTAAIGKRMR